MIIINAVEGKKICLGRIGENEARAVRFDIGKIQAEFPGAEYSLLNMRPSDPDSYPVNSQYIRIGNGGLLWVLQSGDLAEDGLGECELKATLGSQILKDTIWTTEVLRALDGNGTPPEPWESWQQQVEDAADRAEDAAELLEHPGAEAETLPAGSQATASYADGVFTFGIPKGKDGLDGDTPTASVSKVGNTATITITDKDGTTTAQISDGTDGEDGFSPSASVTKSGKTATISITDKEETTTAQISDGEDGEPGAVPIISIGTVTTLPAGSSATASMDTTDPEHPVLSMGIPKGDPGEVTEAELEEATTELKSAIDGKADLIRDTVSNVAIASVPDAAANLPLSALQIAVEPIQAGSGDPSPDNIRPISGWTGCNVSRTNVNVWDEQWELGSINFSTGAKQNSSTNIRSKNYIPVVPDTTYYGKTGNLSASSCVVFFYTEDKTFIRNAYCGNATFTTPTNARYALFYCDSSYGTTYNNDISISYPSTKTDYTPYVGTTYPISWQTEAGTVYGGWIDLVTGEMTVDRVIVTVGNSGWLYYSPYIYKTFNDKVTPNIGSTEYPLVCSMLPYDGVKYASGFSDMCVAQSANKNIYIKDTSCESENAYYQKYSDATILYYLSTPLTYQLTPTQITTLLGQNNVWADCGNVLEMTYPCDTKAYIDKKLTELTALVLES